MLRYAAVDIGSNSTRMLTAEVTPGMPLKVLAAEREVTRLGASVFRDGRLSNQAIEDTARVLARMADTYRRWDVVGVRAVATSAVRDASNQAEFIARASVALGTQVEIVTGREEARLIHQGVMSRWPQPGKRTLIIDIGGGSAEIIANEDGRLIDAVSKQLGAVRLQEIFLHGDPPAPLELHQMAEFIDEKLEAAIARMGLRWDRVIATSATAAAVVCAVNRVSRSRRDQADRLRASTAQIRKLYARLSTLDLAGRRKVAGIGPRRAEIIVAGTGTLLRILERFHVRAAYYSAAGVRDGIIADMAARGVGGELARLSRDQRKEVERVTARFGAQLSHARRVAGFSQILFTGLQPLHQLPLNYGRLLEAASYFCETGHYINDSGHHKHAYYIVANVDLSGFTNREREWIANLCRYHRKAMPSPAHPEYQTLTPDDRRPLLLLIPVLRLADNLARSPEQDQVQIVSCEIQPTRILVKLRSAREPDLAEWAASRVSQVFDEIYGRAVVVSHERV
ncbi:MAG TPA: Ppx/GppA phosphatase family protein [Bryobacteraceae bacterium]|nr:Ppx/GppA phosphatase family protein [Bryobacteraceae bacterium]